MRTYRFIKSFTNPTGVTQLQIKAAAAIPILILRAWINQSTSTTSGAAKVQILRLSAGGATVTAATIATDIRPFGEDDAASQVQVGTTSTGFTASGAGTEGDVLISEGFNILNGWLYLPVPEERIYVKGAGIIGLKFTATPPAATYEIGIIFQELS